MSGNVSTDQISLNSNGSLNVSRSTFLLVYNQYNLSNMIADGVLGLSPSFINEGNSSSGGELFMSALVRAGVIS